MSRQLDLDYCEKHNEPMSYLRESEGRPVRFMRHMDKPNFIKCSACGRIVPEGETEGGYCSECNEAVS
jgi:hypothetical protein